MTDQTLTEFLLARIAEDEQKARDDGAAAMIGSRWKQYSEAAYNEIQAEVLDRCRRTMNECEAKRRIVERHSGQHVCEDNLVGARWNDDIGCDFMVDDPCWNLRALASIYADHPDHRQEWKP